MTCLEQTPSPAPLLEPLPLLPPIYRSFLSSLQLPQTLHLLEHMLEQILAPDDIQMALDLWVLSREPINLILTQATTESGIEFAGKLVVKFGEELGVEEEIGSGGEFVGNSVEEDFGAVVFVLAGCALFGFNGENAQLEHIDAIAEEDCFTACCLLVMCRGEVCGKRTFR